MSKRVPGTQQTVLTVSDEIIHRSLGPDSNKYISEIHTTPPVAESPFKGKLLWKEVGSFLENLTPIEEPPQDPKPNTLTSFKNLLSAPLNYRICNKCNRPLLEKYLSEHLDNCENIMKMKNANKNNATVNGSSKTASTNKKRKPLDFDGSSTKENTPVSTPAPALKRQKKPPKEKKTKKKEKVKATPKAKEPVDVERQCGVPLPGGGFCARSLTCKTHSMGAKRAVLGRSAPYDQLLAAYQRKNQAKMAAGAALAQAAQDELMHGSLIPLDEDEETQLVIEGISRSHPLPLERKVLLPTRIRSKFLRMREMFASALLPRAGSASAGGIEGRTLIIDVDKPNEYFHVVRPPQRVGINQLQQQYQQLQLQQLLVAQLQLQLQLNLGQQSQMTLQQQAQLQQQLLLQRLLQQQRLQQLMRLQQLQHMG